MYQTEKLLRRELQVRYPAGRARIVLRTELDWEKDLESVGLRFVLVPGLTDDIEDIGQIARFTAGLGNVERVDVLPFHQIERFTWKALGLGYNLDNVEPPTVEAVEVACALFRSVGLVAY